MAKPRYGRELKLLAMQQSRDNVKNVRRAVITALEVRDMTPDEIADFNGMHFISVRPKCTKMKTAGELEETGAFRRNATGGMAAELCFSSDFLKARKEFNKRKR